MTARTRDSSTPPRADRRPPDPSARSRPLRSTIPACPIADIAPTPSTPSGRSDLGQPAGFRGKLPWHRDGSSLASNRCSHRCDERSTDVVHGRIRRNRDGDGQLRPTPPALGPASTRTMEASRSIGPGVAVSSESFNRERAATVLIGPCGLARLLPHCGPPDSSPGPGGSPRDRDATLGRPRLPHPPWRSPTAQRRAGRGQPGRSGHAPSACPDASSPDPTRPAVRSPEATVPDRRALRGRDRRCPDGDAPCRPRRRWCHRRGPGLPD